jgi:hypothetical protein
MALITSLGMDAGSPILKLVIDLWVWAPQYLSIGTSMGPMVSFSMRVFIIGVYNYTLVFNLAYNHDDLDIQQAISD